MGRADDTRPAAPSARVGCLMLRLPARLGHGETHSMRHIFMAGRTLGRRSPGVRARSIALPGLMALAVLLSGCGGSSTGPSAGSTQVAAFASDRGNVPGQFDIFLYDLGQQAFYALPNLNSVSVADSSPTVTLDAVYIAFVSARTGGQGGTDVWLYDRSQGALVVPPAVNTAGDETDPAFSGDGLKLAFTRDTLGFQRLRLINGVSDVLIAMPGLDSTTAAWNDWDPAPTQTGQRIAFVSDRNGNPDVFVYDAAGDSLMDLPFLVSAGMDLEPTITTAGRYVCFASDRSGGTGGFDLYLFDLDTKQPVTLAAVVNSAADERHPSLSVGGDAIVFQSNRAGAGGWDLWNHNRITGSVGQGTTQSSITDDIHPSIAYP
jgi:Tol biopolymer transport system component